VAAGRYGQHARPWLSCLCFGRLQSHLTCWAVDKFLSPRAEKVVGYRTKKFVLWGRFAWPLLPLPLPGKELVSIQVRTCAGAGAATERFAS